MPNRLVTQGVVVNITIEAGCSRRQLRARCPAWALRPQLPQELVSRMGLKPTPKNSRAIFSGQETDCRSGTERVSG